MLEKVDLSGPLLIAIIKCVMIGLGIFSFYRWFKDKENSPPNVAVCPYCHEEQDAPHIESEEIIDCLSCKKHMLAKIQ